MKFVARISWRVKGTKFADLSEHATRGAADSWLRAYEVPRDASTVSTVVEEVPWPT